MSNQAPLHDIYNPAPEDRCTASANLAGEHVQCELHREHNGWQHSNSSRKLLWTGATAA